MFCRLTASTARALLCMADVEFGILVIVEAVVACPEPEHCHLFPAWLKGSRGQSCSTVGARAHLYETRDLAPTCTNISLLKSCETHLGTCTVTARPILLSHLAVPLPHATGTPPGSQLGHRLRERRRRRPTPSQKRQRLSEVRNNRVV